MANGQGSNWLIENPTIINLHVICPSSDTDMSILLINRERAILPVHISNNNQVSLLSIWLGLTSGLHHPHVFSTNINHKFPSPLHHGSLDGKVIMSGLMSYGFRLFNESMLPKKERYEGKIADLRYLAELV